MAKSSVNGELEDMCELWWASDRGDVAAVTSLLQKGVSPDISVW